MEVKLTEEEKKEYESLTAKVEEINKRLDELKNRPVVYGYSRVSSKGQATVGNSLESQEHELKAAGAEIIYTDVYTGTTIARPELENLLEKLKSGDTLVVTKLDRMARSVQEGSKLIKELVDKGVAVRILNMGTGPMDDSPTGILMLNIMLSFAQFERDMIVQRTQEGKAIAKLNPDYHEGRPRKYTKKQMDHAMDLLKSNSYTQVVEITGISRATLAREKTRRRKEAAT